MRNREVIEKEIYRAREDLEQSLAELKHVVAEKVDVKARARVAVEKGKQRAQDYLERGKIVAHDALEKGKTLSRDYAERGRDGAVDAMNYAKARPALVGGIAAGVVAVGALAYIGRQRDWW
jgi:hypothetical protein